MYGSLVKQYHKGKQAAEDADWLIEAAGFFDLPETSSPPGGGADYLRYTISVTTPERSHTVQLTDPIEDPQVQALVEYLEAQTK